MVRRRQRAPRAQTRCVKLTIRAHFQWLFAMLLGRRTTAELLSEMPPGRESELAVRWVVRVLCEEEVAVSSRFGFRTRGHWRLKKCYRLW